MCRRPYQLSRIHSLAQRPLLTTSDAIRRPKIRIVLADQIECLITSWVSARATAVRPMSRWLSDMPLSRSTVSSKSHLLGAIGRDPRSSRLDGFLSNP